MEEAVLRLRVECPTIAEIMKYSSSVDILSCKPFNNSDGTSTILTFRTKLSASQLQTHFQSNPQVLEAQFRKIGREGGVAVVTSFKCPCTKTGILNTHVLSIKKDGNWITFHIVFINKQEKEKIIRNIDATGIKYELETTRFFTTKNILTTKQEAVLRHALEKGFFRHPRPMNITQMAKHFGVSASSYTETLKKALEKIVAKVLL
ncbi:MAG: helix-turn-helix domain-containing protein [Candidatus Caldarchaeum sp.]